ncbi:hypothetical protein HIM_09847 [Hirsutella minnesotensis 3608]|uniref:Uncharacterized protein n=1 Tax=Hirsutella minnesotensis 3608 TaxID=1043627 RepID=A0A0F7ZS53_9HYPO|nr:hypothetical protein HIM_09847 [Hirsutella minnesotensis 3608]
MQYVATASGGGPRNPGDGTFLRTSSHVSVVLYFRCFMVLLAGGDYYPTFPPWLQVPRAKAGPGAVWEGEKQEVWPAPSQSCKVRVMSASQLRSARNDIAVLEQTLGVLIARLAWATTGHELLHPEQPA